jgi:phosphate acetyltransferase
VTQRVYVTSSEPSTGKSTIAVGIVQALTRRGQRVGVFRPLVRSADEVDVMLATLLRHATAEASYAECVGVDYREFHDRPADATESVIERAAALESRCDWLVILGSDYTGTEAPTELAENGRLAADLGAVTVLVVNGRSHDGEPRSAEEIGTAAQVGLAELLEVHAEVASVIVSRCDPDRVSDAAEQVRELVGERPTWAIAEDPNLTAPLLWNLLQSVGARVLRGDERALGRPVYGTIIAAMSLESILPRLAENCLVVVPGDRSEILLGVIAADASQNYPSIAGLLVTAGSPVSPEIEAVISGLASTLPLASCDHDTYSTATRLAATRSMLAADSPEKYAIAEELFELHVDADASRRSPSPENCPRLRRGSSTPSPNGHALDRCGSSSPRATTTECSAPPQSRPIVELPSRSFWATRRGSAPGRWNSNSLWTPSESCPPRIPNSSIGSLLNTRGSARTRG